MRSILITRPEPAGGELAVRLKKEGFTVFEAPLSSYIPEKADLSVLPTCQALAFTSAQAVEMFAAQSGQRALPVFTVGDVTAQKARATGFKFVLSGSGNARDLADVLRQRQTELGIQKILHVSGHETAQDLGALLADSNIAVARAVVYRVDFIDTMPADIAKALQSGEIGTVMLFSAMTARHLMKLLGRPDLAKVSEKLEAVCMSDRVAAELRGHPWRVLRVAKNPTVEAMLDIVRSDDPADSTTPSALPAQPVIDAFGGLRPLANRLDLTASTVQGWKKRGMIPEARADAVLAAAREDGIDISALLTEGQTRMSSENGENKNQQIPKSDSAKKEGERRRVTDRRQQKPHLDAQGNILADAYTGPDRRSGMDRRAYEDAKRKKIRAEKWKFMNRTVLMAAFFLISIIYGAGFLLAPEFFEMRKEAAKMEDYERRLQDYELKLKEYQQQQKKSGSLGQMINSGIAKVEHAVETAKTTANTVAGVAGHTMESGDIHGGLQQLFGMLAMLQKLNSTEEGRQAVAQMMARLQGLMGMANGDQATLGQVVDKARQKDPTLNKLTDGMSSRELGAAALLLTLNELRGNMNSERAFEQDLAIVQKFAGNDPAMQKALQNLAPYAKSGVLSKETLQKEFRGIAADIVMAKLRGEDATVRDRVLERLGKYAKVRKVDDIEGNSTDAVVARAEKMLDQGDVRGAIKELQTLEGASAETAQPWMNQAAGNVMADDATAMMMQKLMQQMSGMSGGSVEGVFNDIIRQLKGGSAAVPYVSPGSQNADPGSIYPLAPR